MSLSIGTALKDGFFKVASRVGATLIVAYLVLNVGYLVGINSALKATVSGTAAETEFAAGLALDVPLAVAGGLVALSFILLTYLSVVALRTFAADERQSIRSEHLSGGVALAVVNLLVGYLAYSVLVTIGFVLLVVPGIFLMVVLAFWPLYVAVEGDNFVAAMRRSWALTDGSRFELFLLGAIVLALSFVIGIVVGVGVLVGTLAGVDQSVVSVAQLAVTAPVSLYSFAVLASAFNQLRDAAGEHGGTATSADAPSSPLA